MVSEENFSEEDLTDLQAKLVEDSYEMHACVYQSLPYRKPDDIYIFYTEMEDVAIYGKAGDYDFEECAVSLPKDGFYIADLKAIYGFDVVVEEIKSTKYVSKIDPKFLPDGIGYETIAQKYEAEPTDNPVVYNDSSYYI